MVDEYNDCKSSSKHLILTVVMRDGLVMQEPEEDQAFMDDRYHCINEKLKFPKRPFPKKRALNMDSRVDKMTNFFRLMTMDWKDESYEYTVLGKFFESIQTIFDFKVEWAIHDLALSKNAIGLVQAGFGDEKDEEASLFEVYLTRDFSNLAVSGFLKSFFSSRGLDFNQLEDKPRELRGEEFCKRKTDDVEVYGLFIYVQKERFLIDFDTEEAGIWALKNIMSEFYDELESLFEERDEFAALEKAIVGKNTMKINHNYLEHPIYLKADQNQFYIRQDNERIEMLDFIHLKIYQHGSEEDIEDVIISYLPDLEFQYRSCTPEEYEIQKEKLLYVL
ncbi:MAG: hypothetical protein ACQEW9_04875 [Bacteroidota bacterium]